MVANRSRPAEDLYLVYTGRNQDTGRPIIKAHVNPLVMWLWIGVHMVLIGTLIALIPNMKPGKPTVKEKEHALAEVLQQDAMVPSRSSRDSSCEGTLFRIRIARAECGSSAV